MRCLVGVKYRNLSETIPPHPPQAVPLPLQGKAFGSVIKRIVREKPTKRLPCAKGGVYKSGKVDCVEKANYNVPLARKLDVPTGRAAISLQLDAEQRRMRENAEKNA